MAKCVAVKSLFLALLLVPLVACSGSGDDDDDTTERDAGVERDAGRDGGVVAFECGPTGTCIHPLHFCRVVPTQPCEPRDGGTCMVGEMVCVDEGVEGCTSPVTYVCDDLPSGCTSCPCVILDAPCGAQVTNVECNRAPTGPITARCPFP